MRERAVTEAMIQAYGRYLDREERSPGTIAKYLRDVRAFASWQQGAPVTPESAKGWKEHLLQAQYAPTTINSMLAALNGLFRYLGWNHYRVRFLKIQRRMFRDPARELNRSEYLQLVKTAKAAHRERIGLLMETICSTGIRVSEVRYITVESARQGRARVLLKGKVREILIPSRLQDKLLAYARRTGRTEGPIFCTCRGRQLTRQKIWAEMKGLCSRAGVSAAKVFPHNLRHCATRSAA